MVPSSQSQGTNHWWSTHTRHSWQLTTTILPHAFKATRSIISYNANMATDGHNHQPTCASWQNPLPKGLLLPRSGRNVGPHPEQLICSQPKQTWWRSNISDNFLTYTSSWIMEERGYVSTNNILASAHATKLISQSEWGLRTTNQVTRQDTEI